MWQQDVSNCRHTLMLSTRLMPLNCQNWVSTIPQSFVLFHGADQRAQRIPYHFRLAGDRRTSAHITRYSSQNHRTTPTESWRNSYFLFASFARSSCICIFITFVFYKFNILLSSLLLLSFANNMDAKRTAFSSVDNRLQHQKLREKFIIISNNQKCCGGREFVLHFDVLCCRRSRQGPWWMEHGEWRRDAMPNIDGSGRHADLLADLYLEFGRK